MDKVKQYLAVLRKHHFWILCAIAAAVGLFAWYSSTNKLTAQFKQGADKIQSQLSQLGQIQSPHANETWIEGIQQATQAAKKDVRTAWEKLYQQQKEKIFIWPESLGQDFIAAVNSGQLMRDLRVRYQNAIRRLAAPRLAEIVDALPPGEQMQAQVGMGPQGFGGFPGMGGPGPTAEIQEHRVSWPQLAEIYSWFDWYEAPSTQVVKFAQEELWVLEALCNVIKTVNANSTGAHDAPIKVIEQMAIAYTATNDPATTAGRIQRPQAPATATEASAAAAMAAPGQTGAGRPNPATRLKGTATSGGMGGMGGPDAAAAPTDPDELWKSYRYVDDKGKPLAAGEAGPGEYNLMPFQLALQMDPRELDRLLVECRNSILPIEVREVRINASSQTGGSYAAAPMTAPRAPVDYMAGQAGQPQQQHLARIEISGVVCLIHDPNQVEAGKKLQSEAVPESGAPIGTETAGLPAPSN